MKVVLTVIVSLLCISTCNLTGRAQSSASIAPSCATSAMDVHALPPDLTAGQSKHLFVLEVQNIGRTACTLFPPIAELLPPPNPFRGFLVAGWHDDEESRSVFRPRRFEPGEWAHLVFIWDSRSAPEIACDQFSGIKLQFEKVNPNVTIVGQLPPASIEIRNLWIRACGPVYATGYRKGRYIQQDSPLTYWFNPLKTSESETIDTNSLPKQPMASEVFETSPLLKLHSNVGRIMLGEYLGLRLNFPRGADIGCAFRLLRERDSRGATVISVQECTPAEGASDKPASLPSESGISRLDIRGLDMLPRATGSVEYEVVGAVASSGSRFARAQAKLIVHDPTLPGQADVLAPLPPCKASQLHFVTRDRVVSTKLQTLNAYDATNISNAACSLAGVPRLGMMSKDGGDYPNVNSCPNCDNDLFKVRPSGLVDLSPGKTAHFLVGATGIDTQEDPWMHCYGPPNFKLTLTKDDAPVVLPMTFGACAANDISAWRPGAFDGDPRNERWAKTHDVVFEEPSAPIPADCDKPELLALGRPSMISSNGSLARGFSLASHTFVKGEHIELHQWFDNSSDNPISDNPVSDGGCRSLYCYSAPSFELYDAYGHRVLNKTESERRKGCEDNSKAQLVDNDSRNPRFDFRIPPHTCLNTSYVRLDGEYDLPPGEYTVHIRTDPKEPPVNPCDLHQGAPFVPTPGKDLTFDVLQP